MNSKKFFVKDTAKYGKGVYAKENVKKGELIHKFEGTKLTLKKLVDRIVAGKEYIDDPLQIGRRTYLDLDKFSRTFNHSCDPNAGFKKRADLYAIRNIDKGEQITYDYSTSIAPTEWKMRCKCGSENCRKTLGDVLSIPREQRYRYKKLGAFQRYMRQLLADIEKNGGKYKMPRYEVLALERLGKKKYDLSGKR